MSINAMQKMMPPTGCQKEIPVTKVTEIRKVEFKWGENGAFAPVTLPHTVNADNGTGTVPLLRGEGFYRYMLDVPEKYSALTHWLQFEQAGQRTEIFLNGKLLASHSSGYTPFAVRLNGVKAGRNEIIVQTENRMDPQYLPNSGDFNFCNGIYGKLFLLCGSVALDPMIYGIDRFHVVPLEIGKEKVRFAVKTNVFTTQVGAAEIRVRVTDAKGQSVVDETSPLTLQVNGNEFQEEYAFVDPVLWQGMTDPYLYQIEVALLIGGKVVDAAKIGYGFRALSQSGNAEDCHLRLNGIPIVLRGVALHQDSANVAAAMTDLDRARDQEIIRELGCNYLRCAHYPHNVNEFRAYDKMGLLCQTEIPWVNTFTSGEAYAAYTLEFVKEMIVNLYNHPSIAFWGISNEIAFLNVGQKFLALHNEAVRRAKQLDPTRPVGFVTNMPDVAAGNGHVSDWYGCNTYPGWYKEGNFEQAADVIADMMPLAHFPLHGISEYGYGANPVHHNRNYMTLYKSDKTNTTGISNGPGGRLHPEEYQTFGHIYQWNRIAGTPEGKRLTFTSLWILFDFAVSARDEGETPGINDKGLVTRDRKIKKDAFYFYKCLWNPAPEVHVVSSRWQVRDTSQIEIVVFSNAERVELYQNGKKIATLDAPSDTVNRVVWKFPAIDFTESAKRGTPDVFTAVGYRDGKEIARDTAKFSTKAK